MAASGSFEVTVKVDLHEADAMGARFFEVFHKNLELELREVLKLALVTAQRLAPVGERNYAIEDESNDAVRAGRAGRNNRQPRPQGFAQDAAASGKRVRKIPGGTLRRALQMAVSLEIAGLISGSIGVPHESPAEKYIRLVELGGTIAAKKSKYLRFSPDGKTIVYKPTVYRQPHPFLLPTLLIVWPVLQAVPEKAFEAAKVELGLAA